MTATPAAPSSRGLDANVMAPASVAVFTAIAGVIALAAGASSSLGPIVVIGMHAPLILALWVATGLARGAGGAHIDTSLRFVWCILLYAAICAGAMLILGMLGCLTRGVSFVFFAAIGIGLLAWAVSRHRARETPPSLTGRRLMVWGPLWLIGAMVATFALLNAQYDFDMLYYHLFVQAQWAQEQRIFLVPLYFGEFAPTYYPYAGELLYLSYMLPMGSDHLARAGQFVFFVELMAVVLALGRELRIRPGARVAMVACVSLTPAFAWQSATANVDLALTAHLAAVALFSIRLSRRPRSADAAGLILAIGLSVGTKVLALPYLLALMPLWGRGVYVFIRYSHRRRSNMQLRGAIQALVAGLAAMWVGGFFYVRNWLVTGNPLYPLKVKLGGVTLFDGVFDREAMLNSSFNLSRLGWTMLHEVMADVLRMPYWFAVRTPLDPATTSKLGAWLILVALSAATILPLTSRRFRIPFALPLLPLSAVAMLALFWWSVPYQVPRFLWPPLALSIVAVFGVMSRLPSAVNQWAAAGFATVWLALCGGEVVTTFMKPIASIACFSAALLYAAWVKSFKLAGVVAVCACVIGLGAALWHIEHGGDAPRRAVYAQPRLTGFGDAWKWVDEHLAGKTIAYTGHNIPYFLMGPKLQNRVVHILAGGEAGWSYHDFARTAAVRALGRPNVTDFAAPRVEMDGNTWARRLVNQRVDYVVVSRFFKGPLVSHRHDQDGFPIERQWLDKLATTGDSTGRPLATRTIFGGGWLLFYRLNLPDDESQWPNLTTVDQRETDALDRRRRDGTPPGAPIDGYPFAAQAIEQSKLDGPP